MTRPKLIFAAVAACLLAGGLLLENHGDHATQGGKALPDTSVSLTAPFKASADGTFVAPPMPPAPKMPPAPGMAPSPPNSPPPPATLAPTPTRTP